MKEFAFYWKSRAFILLSFCWSCGVRVCRACAAERKRGVGPPARRTACKAFRRRADENRQARRRADAARVFKPAMAG